MLEPLFSLQRGCTRVAVGAHGLAHGQEPYSENIVLARAPASYLQADLRLRASIRRVLRGSPPRPRAPALLFGYTRRDPMATLFYCTPHFARFPLLELLLPCGDVWYAGG